MNIHNLKSTWIDVETALDRRLRRRSSGREPEVWLRPKPLVAPSKASHQSEAQHGMARDIAGDTAQQILGRELSLVYHPVISVN